MPVLLPSKSSIGLRIAGSALGLLTLAASPALGQVDIPVPNHSFEAPTTLFAWPDADVWEESGPLSEDPQLPGIRDTLDTGLFFNSPVDENGDPSPFFISNADGGQLGFIFAADDDDIAFFQQLNVPFEAGAAYTLKVDVGESFFFPPLTYNPNDPNPPPDPDPALLALRLYYKDALMQKVTLAERLVSADELPKGFDAGVLLAEFAAITGFSVPTDAWPGQPIGVEIRPFDGLSGVWNLDNVRLAVDCGPGGLAGDANVDGSIDLLDHSAFAACITGPRGVSRPAACPPCAFKRLDSEGDGDLDLLDFAELAVSLSP